MAGLAEFRSGSYQIALRKNQCLVIFFCVVHRNVENRCQFFVLASVDDAQAVELVDIRDLFASLRSVDSRGFSGGGSALMSTGSS